MTVQEHFYETYRHDPDGMAFCPYRVCPLGAHSDHQHGKVTGFALDRGIHIAYSVKHNGVVELKSLQFDKRAQWHVTTTPPVRQADWADYLRGATLALAKRHVLGVGLCGVIGGSLPIGGVSSSASVTIAFITALCRVNNIRLTRQELIEVALEAENRYVGVACGKLDQSCEVYARPGHLLYLDTLDDSYELIAPHRDMKPFGIAIFFSGLERSLAGSRFNMRVDECRAAAYALKAWAGMDYGQIAETHLREVPRDIYLRYRERLPRPWALRADHWYSEFDRVERGAEAWRRGDIEAFGRLVSESGHSSIYNYETGSPELKTLYEIMMRTPGIYGGRFSGAGFKGCCMALIAPACQEEIWRTVEEGYLKEFPQLRGRYSAHLCASSEGVAL